MRDQRSPPRFARYAHGAREFRVRSEKRACAAISRKKAHLHLEKTVYVVQQITYLQGVNHIG
jgi:hypothetical protein